MTTVVFHLGDRKTGSTAIQSTLAAGAWQCDTVSLMYPLLDSVNHIALAKSLTDRTGLMQGAGRFARIVAAIGAKNPDVAVISAEYFESVDPAVLKRALASHMPDYAETARFIAYVRPHAERTLSSFAESLKLGQFKGTLEEFHQKFMSRNRLMYTPRFAKWRDVFGERFELRAMIRDRLYRNDVVADLFQFALGGAPFSLTPLPETNTSLTLEDIAMLRHLQIRLDTGNDTRNLIQDMTGRTIARRMNTLPLATGPDTGTKLRMHRTLAEKLAVDYRADAAALDAAFFAGTTPMSDALAAAPLGAIEAAQSVEAADHYTPREMRLIDLWTGQMAEMVRAEPDLWVKSFRQSHQEAMTGTIVSKPGRKKPGGGKAGGKAAPGKGRGMGKAAADPAPAGKGRAVKTSGGTAAQGPYEDQT